MKAPLIALPLLFAVASAQSFNTIDRAADRHEFEWFGLTLSEANSKAAKRSVPFRVVVKNGKQLPRTEDYRPGRINAHTRGDRIIAVNIEGESYTISEGVIDQGHLPFLGLSEAAAKEKADGTNIPFRVIVREGESLPATMDYVKKRANAIVEGGIVIAITPG